MNNSPLLSIIIPTRNREKYAISAITSILGITAADLELVVQDNSDSRELEEYIRSNVNDARLRYNYTPTPLSYVDNFDASVRLASGKYLCIIGDDDGVNPEIIEAARWADRNDIDALKPTVSVVYLWPESEVSPSVFRNPNGVLTIQPFSGKVTKPEPEVEMRRVVQIGSWRFPETDIPRLYHGIVKRECLNKVCEETGAFFGGTVPDIFVALAIANFAKNIVTIDYPLTISGICKSSGSAQSARGEHTGNLEDAFHFKYRGAYKWSDIVPRFYSVQTIMTDTTVAALKALERDDILQDFNLPLFAADCVAAHPKYTRIILRDMYRALQIMGKNQLVGTFEFCYSLLLGPPARGLGRRLLVKLIPKSIKSMLRALLGRTEGIKINDVKDTVEAANILTLYLMENGKQFSVLSGIREYRVED